MTWLREHVLVATVFCPLPCSILPHAILLLLFGFPQCSCAFLCSLNPGCSLHVFITCKRLPGGAPSGHAFPLLLFLRMQPMAWPHRCVPYIWRGLPDRSGSVRPFRVAPVAARPACALGKLSFAPSRPASQAGKPFRPLRSRRPLSLVCRPSPGLPPASARSETYVLSRSSSRLPTGCAHRGTRGSLQGNPSACCGSPSGPC